MRDCTLPTKTSLSFTQLPYGSHKYYSTVNLCKAIKCFRRFFMQNLQVIEIEGKRVLTTKQIAEAYGTEPRTIQYNFRYNKKRYVQGKHYIEIVGDELRELKTRSEIQSSLKYAKSLYLWTEKGALLHAKSLNTDKAWEVYDWLVDFYFRARDVMTKAQPAPTESVLKKPQNEELLDIPNNKETQAKIKRIHNYCTAMQCVLELYNRYIDSDEALGMQKVLFSIGAEICSESFKFREIKVSLKTKM